MCLNPSAGEKDPLGEERLSGEGERLSGGGGGESLMHKKLRKRRLLAKELQSYIEYILCGT